MKSPAISVIVPIYKVEKYLEQCIDSILSQNFEDFEVILVDEGDLDKCREIIDMYEFGSKKDKRVKAIHEKNGGYGVSCNKGFDLACGEYISIIESDDFIAPNMYESLFAKAQKYDADIVKSAYFEYFDETEVAPEKTIYRMDAIDPGDEPFLITDYPQIFLRHPSIWSAIYRREFLNNEKIRFITQKGASWIDNLFQVMTLCLAQKIVWDKEAYYFYRMSNENSSTNFLKDFNTPFDRTDEVHSFLESYGARFQAVLPYLHKREIVYIDKVIQSGFTPQMPDVKKRIDKMLSRISEEEVLSNSCFRAQERDLYFALKKL